MDQCTQSHRAAFVAWYSNQPKIKEAVHNGIDVFDFFTEEGGARHYCYVATREALTNWLKDNPESERDIREEFITELTENVKRRRDFKLRDLHSTTEMVYMAGVRDAIGTLLSMMGDCKQSSDRWRLATTEGNVVGFYNPTDKESPDLVTMFHDKINT